MGDFKWLLPVRYFWENFDGARCSLTEKSLLLSAPHRFDEKMVAVPVPGERPQERPCSIPHPCPGQDGTYEIEVGLELADVLPLPDSMEDAISVSYSGRTKELTLSNQMLKVLLCIGTSVRRESIFALSPRVGIEGFATAWGAEFGTTPHSFLAEPANTIVAARYTVQGHNAETAVCRFLNESLSDFFEGINKLLSCYREAIPATSTHVRPYYDTAMFPYGYVLIKGDQAEPAFPVLVQMNFVRMVSMRVAPLDKQQREVLRQRAACCDDIPVYRQLLGEAKSLQSSGFNQEALLRSVFAAEACVSAFVQQRLVVEGVSRSRLEDNSKDMPFSRMLNIDLFALCPAGEKPDRDLVGRVNRARGLRNKLAHGKNLRVSAADAKEAVESVKGLVGFIEGVATKMGIALVSIL